MPTGLEGYREGTEQRRQPGTDTPQTTAYGSCIGQLINLPGWEALVITKAGPLWRGVSIALSETLTRMAAPSWGWPTATFLRVELRSRGSKKTGGEKESKRYHLIRVINQNRRSPRP